MPAYFVLNTHDWLHTRLMASDPPAGHEMAPTPREADLVIYPEPPWFEGRSPNLHRAISPGAWPRLYVFSQADGALTWAPGLYTSLRGPSTSAGPYGGGFYVYHLHYGEGSLGEFLDARYAEAIEPDLLWSFIGSVDSRRSLRQRIVELGDDRGLTEDSRRWNNVVRWDWYRSASGTAEARRIFDGYARTMARSKFVICPGGVGPSSIRLFEAMRMGRCPVIVSDDWTPPFFADWERCAVRIRESEVHNVPAILREREEHAAELGAMARTTWERLYSAPMLLTTLVESCLLLDVRDFSPRRRATSALRALGTREGLRRSKQATERMLRGA